MNQKTLIFLSFIALLSFEAIASSDEVADLPAIPTVGAEIADLYTITESPGFKDSVYYDLYPETVAIYSNNNFLKIGIEKGDLNTVKEAIKERANVNHKIDGKTPVLVLAAKLGNPEIVDLLLQKGANINATDEKGKNALLWAIDNEISLIKDNPRFAENFSKIGELLIEKGIDINATDPEGRSPLIAAAWGPRKKFVKLLLDKAADATMQTRYGLTALDLAKEAAKSSPKNPETAETVKLLEQAHNRP